MARDEKSGSEGCDGWRRHQHRWRYGNRSVSTVIFTGASGRNVLRFEYPEMGNLVASRDRRCCRRFRVHFRVGFKVDRGAESLRSRIAASVLVWASDYRRSSSAISRGNASGRDGRLAGATMKHRGPGRGWVLIEHFLVADRIPDWRSLDVSNAFANAGRLSSGALRLRWGNYRGSRCRNWPLDRINGRPINWVWG